MTKAELESKSLSELHSLAAEANVPKFRMLPRGELVNALADDSGDAPSGGSRGGGGGRPRGEGGERSRRRRRPAGEGSGDRESRPRRERKERAERPERKERGGRPERKERAEEPPREDRQEAQPEPAPSVAAAAESSRPRRRRRRFGRRGKDEVTLQGLLLPPEAGRQALLCAETREGCTGLLRGIAADLSADSKGPDPVALLIDPSPEELGDWKRDAPQAEIVSAGQPRHASDALAQAKSRAAAGDDVILLVDSLTRLAAAYGEADAAKEFFDAGRATTGSGSLTVVAALERPSA